MPAVSFAPASLLSPKQHQQLNNSNNSSNNSNNSSNNSTLTNLNTNLSNTAEPSTRSPLPALRSSTAYYHPNYPPHSPHADLVLASSDKRSCWFAINRSQLFCGEQAFRTVGLESVTPDSGLPLIKLGESKAVIEVILGCLQADTIPDFGHPQIDFRVLVSALEAAADKYKLVHIEKMCLLALGAYSKTHPVEVYTLASHYSCRWLAEAASESTLAVDITQPEYQDILTSETHAPLVDLYRHRIESAKSIIRSKRITYHPGLHQHIDRAQEFWESAADQLISQIKTPIIDFQALFSPILDLALDQFPDCARCYAALVDIQHQIQAEWAQVPQSIQLSPMTNTSASSSSPPTPPAHILPNVLYASEEED